MTGVAPAGPPPPIPLSVLTGFLGAGKTTYLNRALAAPDLAGTLVVVNELGDAPLDQHLLCVSETDLALLSSGCLCCTLRGSLTRLLEDLLRRKDNRRMPDFQRVVIETTGLADPAPLLAAVLAHPYLSRRYRLAGVVTLVDAVNAGDTLNRHAEARRQIVLADTLLISKSDVARPAALRGALADLNPHALCLDAAEALTLPDAALFISPFSPHRRSPEARSLLWRESLRAGAGAAGRHDPNVRAFAIALETPMTSESLSAMLAALTSRYGRRLLRLKGLVAVNDQPAAPFALHVVLGQAAPPQPLAGWPVGLSAGTLQIIGEDLDETSVGALIAEFARPAPG